MFIFKIIWWLWCSPGKFWIWYDYVQAKPRDMNDITTVIESERRMLNIKILAPLYSLTLWPLLVLVLYIAFTHK